MHDIILLATALKPCSVLRCRSQNVSRIKPLSLIAPLRERITSFNDNWMNKRNSVHFTNMNSFAHNHDSDIGQ